MCLFPHLGIAPKEHALDHPADECVQPLAEGSGGFAHARGALAGSDGGAAAAREVPNEGRGAPRQQQRPRGVLGQHLLPARSTKEAKLRCSC